MNRYQLKPISHRRPFRQRGAATLIVVMLLFFIISMVAAYTSRNLIFEQRTSANQYRSTQAFEAAEAGLEWAVAQLNAGRMSTSCAASAASVLGTIANDSSFARRYLTVDAVSGAVTPIYVGSTRQPQCVFGRSSDTATDWAWRCSCPLSTAGANTLSQPGGSGPTPAFRVRMLDGFDSQQVGPRTDLIQIESNSCTRLADSCLQFDNDDRGGTGDGVARERSGGPAWRDNQATGCGANGCRVAGRAACRRHIDVDKPRRYRVGHHTSRRRQCAWDWYHARHRRRSPAV